MIRRPHPVCRHLPVTGRVASLSPMYLCFPLEPLLLSAPKDQQRKNGEDRKGEQRRVKVRDRAGQRQALTRDPERREAPPLPIYDLISDRGFWTEREVGSLAGLQSSTSVQR